MPARRTLAVLALAAVTADGCAHQTMSGTAASGTAPFVDSPSGGSGTSGFRCPAQGGPAWFEATSEHFVVSGDLTRGEITALARQFEEVRGAIIEGIFPGEHRQVDGRARVVAFRHERDFDEFAPPELAALLWPSGLGDHVIVVSIQTDLDRRQVVAHEIAHHVLRQVYPRQPRWFGEGFAALAELLAGERDPGEELLRWRSQLAAGPGLAQHLRDEGPLPFFADPAAVREGRYFGRLSAGLARGYRAGPVLATELLAWDGRLQHVRHRAASAVLVHFLVHEEPARFYRFRRLLEEAERPEVAWAEVFPEWDPTRLGGPEALDVRLAAHARSPGATRWLVDVPVRGQPEVRALSAGEVHALRLALPRYDRNRGGGPALERAEVEEALAEDPDHVLGLVVKAALDGGDPLPLARRAAAAHPDDLRALVWLAQSLPRDGSARDERLSLLRRAVAVAPWNGLATGNLAWFLVQGGEVNEALPLAERAVRLSPGNANTLDTLAAVLEAAGRCEDALRTAERALDFLPEGASDQARAPWTERAGRLRVMCGERREGRLPPVPPVSGTSSPVSGTP
jgi:tetratricopeptide (TPR) repeat protein